MKMIGMSGPRISAVALMTAMVAAGAAVGSPVFRPAPQRDPLPDADEQARRIAAAEEKRQRRNAKRLRAAKATAPKEQQ